MAYVDDFRQILSSPAFSTCRLAAWLPAVEAALDLPDLIETYYIEGEEPPALFLDAVEQRAVWDGDEVCPYEMLSPDDLQ